MKDIKEFISTVISEAALDNRVEDGMVDLHNGDHLQVVAEIMCDYGLEENVIEEFVDSFVDEGKHPDRQAFNKDGWLVTFPSPEYKLKAIKKGTHFASDPTHGKGGMNLYYRKHGKQKRQTQQVTTATSPDQEPASKLAPQDGQTTDRPEGNKSAGEKAQEPQQKDATAQSNVPSEKLPIEPSVGKPTDAITSPTDKDVSGTKSPASTEPSPQPTTGASPDIMKSSISQFVDLSKKFAESKGWISTPSGEYRDSTGIDVAVVALSGEVVPIKSVYRDELKLFVEKTKA